MACARRHLLRVQGAYYCLTGLWPLASMRSFEAVTGKKTDRWLVQMVGLLAASIGASLIVSARSKKIRPPVLTLSVTSALAFAGIDIAHASRRRISPMYLGDAAIELLILAALLAFSAGEHFYD